jgi:hypothetical protein
MNSIADYLPPEIARQVHPDWRKNEEEYWKAREGLLGEYQNQWIGFADGGVIASGLSPVAVLHAAQSTGRHPFIICVGREQEPCRIRRTVFPYNMAYPGEPLPLIRIEFRQTGVSQGIILDRVIPDTGADSSILPWADCQLLQLAPAQGVPGFLSGVAGGSTGTLAFQVEARLDGQDYPCRVQADFVGTERILGRDVLNHLEILFRGPAGEVVLNP